MIDRIDSELPIKLEQERTNLSFEIAKWRKQQQDVMPDVINHLPRLSPSTSIEHEQLLLPSESGSDLSPLEREKCGVTHLVHQELQLRKGQAHDALRSLSSPSQVCDGIILPKKCPQKCNPRSISQHTYRDDAL